MANPIHILDGTGTKQKVKVTAIGQLATAPFAYDEVKVQTLDADNVAENFFTPRVGFQVVITGVIIGGDRLVSANDGALVEIFAADSPTSDTALGPIITLSVTKNSTIPILGLNFLVAEGVYINAKADDSNVLISIMGYYIPSS